MNLFYFCFFATICPAYYSCNMWLIFFFLNFVTNFHGTFILKNDSPRQIIVATPAVNPVLVRAKSVTGRTETLGILIETLLNIDKVQVSIYSVFDMQVHLKYKGLDFYSECFLSVFLRRLQIRCWLK